jgi:hypothetical protein
MKEFFPITSVCRADLYDFLPKKQADALGDDEMQWIAEKVGDACLANLYWESLKWAVEELSNKS